MNLWEIMTEPRRHWVETPKPSCDQSPAIEELQRKLKASEDAFAKLNAEIEQGYVKDRLGRSYDGWLGTKRRFVHAEYIEKLGVRSVKLNGLIFDYPEVSTKVIQEWTDKDCIALRDFLVKNFPMEPSEIKVSKDSVDIKAESIHITGATVFSGTEELR